MAEFSEAPRPHWWMSGLMRDWRLLVMGPLAIGFLAALFTFLQPRDYSGSTTFIPQAALEGSGGNVSGLAAQFGLMVGARPSAQTPDFYAALARSRMVLAQVAVTPFPSLQGASPGEAAQTMVTLLTGGQPQDGEARARTLELLEERVRATAVPQTGVVQLTVRTPSAALSEEVAEQILDIVERFDLDNRQERARAERRFIETRLSVAEAELSAAEEVLKSFLQENREFRNAPDLFFQHERLQRAVNTRQQLWASLAESLEQARLEEVRNTPLITVIDPPAESGRPLPRGTIRMGVLFWLLSLGLGALVVLGRAWAVHVEGGGSEEHAQWAATLRQMPRGVRWVWARSPE
ncbi:MAG: hypothetical protein WEA09_03955 [Gemmatimonadota bacterium]